MEWLSATVDYGIIGLLVVMSIIAVSIAVERHLVYKKIRLEDFDDKKSLEIELTKKNCMLLQPSEAMRHT